MTHGLKQFTCTACPCSHYICTWTCQSYFAYGLCYALKFVDLFKYFISKLLPEHITNIFTSWDSSTNDANVVLVVF